MRFKGAESRLDDFQFIKTEAADFESYKNCGTTPQIQDFLRKRQFTLTRRVPFARLSLPASTVISCSSGNDSEADRLLNGTPFSRVTRLAIEVVVNAAAKCLFNRNLRHSSPPRS